jgi:hypothetical protein
MDTKTRLRQKAIDVFELTKGYTPEQRSVMGNLLTTMEEMAGYVLELTAPVSDLLPEPHDSDKVACTWCGYEWTALFPVGCKICDLECPDCGNQGGTVSLKDW